MSAAPASLSPAQVRGFWAAWSGWALDGMDSFIFALVLAPALTELLPRSGMNGDAGHVVFAGSVLFAVFLAGWGTSLVWGPIADHWGRTRTQAAAVTCYALFTAAAALAQNVWQLGLFRLNGPLPAPTWRKHGPSPAARWARAISGPSTTWDSSWRQP